MRSVVFQEVAKEAQQRPSLPRSGAMAATLPPDHGDDAIMFGGYVEEPISKKRYGVNETWLFSRSKGGWRPLQPTSEQAPGPRIAAQAVVVGNSLYVIGGWDPSQQGPDAFLTDFWRLDLSSWAWERLQPQGDSLDAGISRFQAVAVGSKVYIHTHRSLHDIWVLDTTQHPPALQRLPVAGPAPSSRGLHSMTNVGDALYVIGGAPKEGPMLDDVWRLDLTTSSWTQLQPSGATPHARCSQAAAAVPGTSDILVFGGAYYGTAPGLTCLSDVHVLDTEAGAWLQPAVEVAGGGAAPAARNAGVMVALPAKLGAPAQLLLHGGWRAFVETYNDTYLIDCS